MMWAGIRAASPEVGAVNNLHLTLETGQWTGPAPHTRGRLDLQVTAAGDPVNGWWHPADEPDPIRATGVWVREHLLDEAG